MQYLVNIAYIDVNKLLAHAKQIRVLKSQLIQQFKEIKPDCVINSPEEECLPNTLSITFPNVENAGLMAMLDYHGIAVDMCHADEVGNITFERTFHFASIGRGELLQLTFSSHANFDNMHDARVDLNTQAADYNDLMQNW